MNIASTCEQHRTLQEIADMLGVTKQAVRDTENRALRKLVKSQILRQLAVDLGVLSEEDKNDERTGQSHKDARS